MLEKSVCIITLDMLVPSSDKSHAVNLFRHLQRFFHSAVIKMHSVDPVTLLVIYHCQWMSVRLNFWNILGEQVVEVDVYHCNSGVGLPLLLRLPVH